MNPDDLTAVTALLGREPRGDCEVVSRTPDGAPVVIRNAPLLADGTPMPTLYWLVGKEERDAVSRLEAAGGVKEAERSTDPEQIADAHARYAAERDAALEPAGSAGAAGAAGAAGSADSAESAGSGQAHPPRPSGGVGGTRQGVKCLHAHVAWYLAGGDDPVGRWAADRLGLDPGAYVR